MGLTDVPVRYEPPTRLAGTIVVTAAIPEVSQTKDGIHIKLRSKVQALELLVRHLGLLNDKLRVDTTLTVRPDMSAFTDDDLRQLRELRKQLPPPED